MIYPYNKHQYFPERDLLPRERLEPARAALRYAIELLRSFEDITTRAHDSLTDDKLQTICNAVDAVVKAAENARFLGESGYNAQTVDIVSWNKGCK